MRIMLLFIAISLNLSAQAAVYRWVDQNGVVRYSDTPHPDAERLKMPSAPTSDSAAPEPSASTNPNDPTPLAAGKASATDQERCDEFTARVQRYSSTGDMFTENPDGTRQKVNAEERQQLIARTQTQADAACEKLGR